MWHDKNAQLIDFPAWCRHDNSPAEMCQNKISYYVKMFFLFFFFAFAWENSVVSPKLFIITVISESKFYISKLYATISQSNCFCLLDKALSNPVYFILWFINFKVCSQTFGAFFCLYPCEDITVARGGILVSTTCIETYI